MLTVCLSNVKVHPLKKFSVVVNQNRKKADLTFSLMCEIYKILKKHLHLEFIQSKIIPNVY